ncbi:pyrimidine-nucleoside phosphorylase [Paenibacillus thalictri]|uniref:Pyrimidine-nucleoside phosphorylase n=1 Tax=Paenibacillus thalictri TaxID=2527873 RepID=A0A4Q9DX50_9BACL|nr:pyrimidine-nucleoside phosphorylase [Paenibacillus thalictri]TBL79811.1 pyrimidine-nucleoside phosphorylase [Paenibacillus thalictri]
MRTVDLIQRKRDGLELSREEIEFLINGFTNGDIPDYQMSAWAMAVFYRGMNARETADLTMAMARSGDQMDLSAIPGVKVDKHSTGGVGDTTTIVLGPLVAALGVPVAKMSGRGLGHTGGTIDKLEAIQGFTVERTREQFVRQVSDIGVAVISQSGNITPADKKLYALRDVTATVDSIPLIASSIMSKKIASGADRIVLDVKTGSGAFMKTLDESIHLAQAMVDIGEQVGRETVAVITNMDEPLGLAIGNALEIREAVDTLRGEGPADLEALCIQFAAYMTVLGGQAASFEEAKDRAEQAIRDGSAIAKLKQFIHAQGGNASIVDDPAHLPSAPYIVEVPSESDGYIKAMDAESLGITAMMLGAGRATKEDVIDMAVGVLLKKKVGDPVQAGEALLELHMNRDEKVFVQEMSDRARQAITVSQERAERTPLIQAVVTKQGVQRF